MRNTEIAAALDELGDVETLHRARKMGIGPAYLAGFARALEAGAGRIVQMDADFSHDPADLPRLLDATGAADLAIGSRYAPGGRILDWGAGRLAISRWGSAYARTVLGLEVRDMTSGFKCWRRATLEAIELDSVRSHGYAFQVEMTFRAVRAGFEVVEVPITFRDRQHGKSKMNWRIAREAVVLLPRIRRFTSYSGGHGRPHQRL